MLYVGVNEERSGYVRVEAKLAVIAESTVGDFVRSAKQLMDLLMQIAGASEQLRPVCREAIKRLDRGVVSYMVDDL